MTALVHKNNHSRLVFRPSLVLPLTCASAGRLPTMSATPPMRRPMKPQGLLGFLRQPEPTVHWPNGSTTEATRRGYVPRPLTHNGYLCGSAYVAIVGESCATSTFTTRPSLLSRE